MKKTHDKNTCFTFFILVTMYVFSCVFSTTMKEYFNLIDSLIFSNFDIFCFYVSY